VSSEASCWRADESVDRLVESFTREQLVEVVLHAPSTAAGTNLSLSLTLSL